MSKIVLKPYQQQVLDELEFLPSVALFLGTGSGKTYTSLFKAKQNKTKNLLVVCPANVVNQWHKSITEVLPNLHQVKFRKSQSAKMKNKSLYDLEGDGHVVVVSLQILYKLSALLQIINNDWTIIIDESHKIKELGTRRNPVKVTQMALKLGELTEYKILLTATPTQKEHGGYIDYYTQLRFLGYVKMTQSDFEDRYCRIRQIVLPGRPYPIPKIIGYKNTHEIDDLLSVIAKRYVPKFVDGDPVLIKVDIDTTPRYKKFERERFYNELNVQNLTAMRIARKTLVGGIISGRDMYGEPVKYVDNTHKRDWVSEFLSNTDETIVIFYKYNVELEQLEDVCKELNKKYIVLNGANKNKTEDISNKDYEVVLGQINACGESVDGLQYKSHIVVYYAMPESSLEYKQSMGRIDRVGQVHLPIYYHLVMQNTVDADIYQMTLNKVEFNEKVLNRLNIDFEMEDE